MSTPSSRPENSTTVRSLPWQVRALRAAFGAVSPVLPGLAARAAERLFLSAKRRPRPAAEHVVLERATRSSVAWSGVDLPTWSWGEGEAVLLVHGWEGRGAQLGAFVEPLVEAGYRVVTFDGPGHGDAPRSSASLMDLASAIAAVADATGPLHAVIAHSMGGAATALAISRGLAAPRAVFVAPPAHPKKFARAFFDMLAIGAEVERRMLDRVRARYGLSIDDLGLLSFAPRLDAPLLVIHDEGDREVPWQDGHAIASAWPGAKLVTTRGLGHRRILRSSLVIDEALGFLRRADPRDAPAPAQPPVTWRPRAAGWAAILEEGSA